jgi:RNA polymerase-binding transcription factor DksA
MLTKQQIETLERKLREEEKDITEQLAHIDDDLDFGDEIDHLEEETDESEELANRVGVKDSLEKRLERVTSALEKIRNGTYGQCEQCKGDISMELLSVDPESLLCKNCKAAHHKP